MTDDAGAPVRSGGLRHILIATAVAGAIGYLIQVVVPQMAPHSYLEFATMWSAVYLVVTCLSGVQQELTRSARPDPSGSGFRTWAAFTAIVAVAAAGVTALVFGLAGTRIFPTDTAEFVGVLTTAAFGYCLVAAVSGAIYGLQDWDAVAGMTIADSLLRALAVGAALIAGGSAILLGWATALPFLLAVIVISVWRGGRVRQQLGLDAPLGRLLRNAGATVVASLATGALISGLPLLLNAFASDAGPRLLASLVLAITLTRAPLVVPLLALQGYLIVTFRDRQSSLTSALLRWILVALAALLALATIAALLGPLVMGWLFASYAPLSGLDLALIVVSGGLTGVMCITGPAVLAAGRHTSYTVGWVTSAIVTILLLLVPLDPHARIIAALIGGPLSGAVVHLWAVGRQRVSAAGSASSARG